MAGATRKCVTGSVSPINWHYMKKNGALLTHWFAILAQSKLLGNFSSRKSIVSLLFYHCLTLQFRQLFPREPTSLTRVLGSHVTFCFIYAVRIWPPLLGSKKWIQEYPQYIPRRPLSLGPSSSIVLRLCGIPFDELLGPFLFLDSTWFRAFYSVRISCKAGQHFNVHHSHVGKRKLISSRTCRIKTSAIYWGFVPVVLSLCHLDSHILSLLFGFVENHKFPSNVWQQFREWRFSSNLAMAPSSRLVLGVPRERLAIGVIELWSNSSSSFLHRCLCIVAFPPFLLSYWDNFSSLFLCLVSLLLVWKVSFAIDGRHNVRLYVWRPQGVCLA